MSSLVCRVCLASDVRMHCIEEDLGLQEIYEKVTSTKLYTEDRRPVTICYICCSQLQNCNRFAKKSQRAEKMLTELIDNGLEIIHQNLSVITNLAVTATTFISLDECSNSECALEVKKEEISEAEESDHNGFEILNIEPFETKEEFVIEAFPSESNMEIHLQNEEKPLVCNSPVATSGPKIDENVHSEKRFICDYCNKAFVKRGYVRDHIIRIHFRTKSYSCKQCDASLTSYRDLQKHSKKHRISRKHKQHTCNTCGKIFCGNGALQRHIRVHTGEKPYACDQCHMAFSDNSAFKRHKVIHTKPLRTKPGSTEKKRKRKPPKKGKHTCKICNKTVNSKTSLRHHHARKHLERRPYPCDQCIKAFVTKPELTKHSRTHTDEKPFICDYCSKSFHSKTLIKHHLKLHIVPRITQKNHICHTCGKACKSPSLLKVHRRMHTGERPYSCNDCNKTFVTKSGIQSHKKNSTGKLLSCSKCNKTFCRQGDLSRHLRLHSECMR